MRQAWLSFAIVGLFVASCAKEDVPNTDLPTLSTTAPYDIGSETAIAGGNITDKGDSDVTVRGVCWDTLPQPTIAKEKTEDGSGVGSFTSMITGLNAGRTYYLRAYATNTAGTSYGNEEVFSTAIPGIFTDPRDGNEYKTVTIGSQVWMCENLRYLPDVHNNDEFKERTTPGYGVYGYDGNDLATAKAHPNYLAYGAMYNWPAASIASPPGWHLPSAAEWDELKNFIASDGHAGTEGTALKSTYGWTCGVPGTDDYSFTALSGGIRSASVGTFDGQGTFSDWWTSTEGSACCITYRSLVCSYGFLDGSPGGHKSAGFYIRCVKD